MKPQSTLVNCSFLCSWSGGKDSYLAFYKALRSGALPSALLNVLNERGETSRSHGIPKPVLRAQAECLNLPIEFTSTSWADYEAEFIKKLRQLKSAYSSSHIVFGDIDIESHKAWEEKVSEAADLQPFLPLWQQNREALVNEMIEIGIKALIVSCRSSLASQLLGKVIDKELLDLFSELGIDACGENGEYHTLVIDGPLHQRPLEVKTSNVMEHGQYAFIQTALIS